MFYHALTGNGGVTPTEDLKPVLLWENSSPAKYFNKTSIDLDLNDYAGIIIEGKNLKSVDNTRVYIKKDDTNFCAGVGSSTENGFWRSIVCSNTGISYILNRTGETAGFTPLKIYGIKSYVVEVNYEKHYVQWTAANSPYVLETDKPVQMIYFKSSSTASEYLVAYLNDDGTYSSYSAGYVFTKISDTKIKIGYSSSSENFTSGTFQVYYII